MYLFPRGTTAKCTDWMAQTTNTHSPHNTGAHHPTVRCWQVGFFQGLYLLSLQMARVLSLGLHMVFRVHAFVCTCVCVRVHALILLPRLLIIQFFLGLFYPWTLCRSSNLSAAVDSPPRIVVRTASHPHFPF